MKKIILVSLLLGACSKKISCGFLEAPVKEAASKIASSLECDVAKVEGSLRDALVKIKVCESNSGYSSINGKNILCSVVPIVVKAIGDSASKSWACKKAGSNLSEIVSKAVGCE